MEIDVVENSTEVCGFWDFKDNYGEGPEDWRFSYTQGILCGGR